MTDLSLVHTLDAILSRDTHDLDPAETAEWRDALDALTTAHGPSRARFILDALLAHARRNGVNWLPSMTTPYATVASGSAHCLAASKRCRITRPR